MYKAVIYKDSFNGTACPWRADLYKLEDGATDKWDLFINAWISGRRTQGNLIKEIFANYQCDPAAPNCNCYVERRAPELDS